MSTPAGPLYRREGSRFVLYDARAQHAPPIRRVPVPDVPDLDAPDERPNWTAVPAARCPHGHFARWAASNCCAPR